MGRKEEDWKEFIGSKFGNSSQIEANPPVF